VSSRAGTERLLSLEGRTALVAGGSGGIGSATAALLLAAGARVVSVDREGRAAPEGSIGLECDLSDARSVRAMFAELERGELEPDIVVHSAGVVRDGMLWKLDDSAWSDVLRANLDSAFHLLRGAIPCMRRCGRGSVVLVSSINGERGKIGQANYAASKAGLLGLARTAARELGPSGIRVNVVAPGMVRTPMTEALPDAVLRGAAAEAALGRIAEPDDVARVVLFLCSDMSRHVTGQVLRVDGGQLIA
jgi:NAD(P)-dependent dehydrogenase (short-subunit alcohol dehydrogenase family)